MDPPTNWAEFCQKYYSKYNYPIKKEWLQFKAYSVIIQSQNKIPDKFINFLNKKWPLRPFPFRLPRGYPLPYNKFFRAYLQRLHSFNKPFKRYNESDYTLVCNKAIATYSNPLKSFVRSLNGLDNWKERYNYSFNMYIGGTKDKNFILIYLKTSSLPDLIKTKGPEPPPVISSPLPANMSDSEKFQTLKLHVTSSLDLENNFLDNIGPGHEFYDIFEDTYTYALQTINTNHLKFKFTNYSFYNNSSENAEKFLKDIGEEIANSIKEVLEDNMDDEFYVYNSWEITYKLKLLNENTMHLGISYVTFNDKEYERDFVREHFLNYKVEEFDSKPIEFEYVTNAYKEEERRRQEERQERQRSQKRKRENNHTDYLNNMTREQAMSELDIKSTDRATVRKAYFKKAKIWHPDKHRNKPESEKKKAKKMIQTLNRAKEILAPHLRYYLYQLKF